MERKDLKDENVSMDSIISSYQEKSNKFINLCTFHRLSIDYVDAMLCSPKAVKNLKG